MTDNKNESLTFHDENAILRIAMWANVVAWAILVLYLLNFANDLYSVISNWPIPMPPEFMDKMMMFAGILSKPAFGFFYFFVLRGLTQGLYLGLDLFINDNDEEYDDELEEKAAE